MNVIPIILSGGSGTRLWPLSRPSRPKQFLAITEEQTLLQLTLRRIQGLSGAQAPIVVANAAHRFLVAEQCNEIAVHPKLFILEPFPRNTAPAIALAALAVELLLRQGADQDQSAEDYDPILLVLPSDHLVTDVKVFHQAVALGTELAASGRLVTFGVIPTRPETGYGYIRAPGPDLSSARLVEQFVEKPNMRTAQTYLEAGDYFWNAGVFMFRTSTYLEELQRRSPEIISVCRNALLNSRRDLEFLRVDPETFQACPSDSIDYCVLERTDKASLVPLAAGWSDVGSWSAVWQLGQPDSKGNVTKGDVTVINSDECLVHSEHRMVGLLGVKDLIVVETSDAVLVADKRSAQDVKQLVEALRDKNNPQADIHRQVFRPWGSFDSIDQGDRYQVKRLTVKQGGRLSLQFHRHRAEHWVVVRGTAKVLVGESEFLVCENESVFIPVGVPHRLENPGETLLEIIEVQTGTYLGEDDIVRLADNYGRV